MATQRFISTSFWDDEWVISLSPEEKLTYLYLMTNTLTNIAGVYKLTLKRMAYDMDMDKSSIKSILERFEKDGKAYYFGEYIVIPTWPKHQKIERHPKLKAGIFAVIDSLSDDVISFLRTVNYCFDLSKYDSLSKPMDSDGLSSNYSDPDPDSDSDPDPDPEVDTDIYILSGKPDDALSFQWEVLDYLNEKTGKSFKRVTAHATKIKARIREGYTLEDFKKVIDSRVAFWRGKDDFEKYLRPETLFGTKFDSYLAEANPKKEAPRGPAPVSDSAREILEAVRKAGKYD